MSVTLKWCETRDDLREVRAVVRADIGILAALEEQQGEPLRESLQSLALSSQQGRHRSSWSSPAKPPFPS